VLGLNFSGPGDSAGVAAAEWKTLMTDDRHQIESPKRAPKESVQGRLPLTWLSKIRPFILIFQTAWGLEHMAAGRCEVAVASPSYALGASDVPQCQSGP
jgi:hypothetical protein